MPASLSQFARGLSAETAFDVLAVARRLKAGGKDVIELQIGDSPFPTTRSALDAGVRAIGRPSAGCRYFAAIVWASGRITAGTMWLSTSSWQIRRWLRYDSTNDLNGCRPQYCRIVKYTLIGASGNCPVRIW